MKRAFLTLVLAVTAALIPAAKANAQVGIAVRVGPAAVAYAPACPGPGYVWAPGYYAGAVWVPGRWAYRSYYRPYYYHPYWRHSYYHPYYGRRW